MAKKSSGKNVHAVALGKLGGKVGGNARAQALGPTERKSIAAAGGRAKAAAGKSRQSRGKRVTTGSGTQTPAKTFRGGRRGGRR